MKILIAPDSFKDALSALQVCEAIRRGVLAAMPDAQVQIFPLADGGEGTAEVLKWHLGGELVQVQVADPLFRPIRAHFFSFPTGTGGKTAFVEMAQASGLELLRPVERNPLKNSTFGTGQLVLEALRQGATTLYLAIGGSATNDAGMGMAMALGWRFLDNNGKDLTPIGENLIKVQTIVPPYSANLGELQRNSNPKITVLSDVTNPLYGANGAAFVFAQQKGADADAVRQLDEGLRHFSELVASSLGTDFSGEPGAGAAGGLGFGAMAFLGADIQPGAYTVMQLVGFEEVVKKADLIITGEGKLDGQTQQGKLVGAICHKAKVVGVPVLAICGIVDATEPEIKGLGLWRAYQLKLPNESLERSLSRTAAALETVAEEVLRAVTLSNEKQYWNF